MKIDSWNHHNLVKQLLVIINILTFTFQVLVIVPCEYFKVYFIQNWLVATFSMKSKYGQKQVAKTSKYLIHRSKCYAVKTI